MTNKNTLTTRGQFTCSVTGSHFSSTPELEALKANGHGESRTGKKPRVWEAALCSAECTNFSYRREKCFLDFSFDMAKSGRRKQQKEDPVAGVALCCAAHTPSVVIVAGGFRSLLTLAETGCSHKKSLQCVEQMESRK